MQISGVQKRHIEGDTFSVSVIVTGSVEHTDIHGEVKIIDVACSSTFFVDGEDNIPFREDYVDVSVDLETYESHIIARDEWYPR